MTGIATSHPERRATMNYLFFDIECADGVSIVPMLYAVRFEETTADVQCEQMFATF